MRALPASPRPTVVLTGDRGDFNRFEMEVYVEPARRRTLPLRRGHSGRSVVSVDLPEMAMLVFRMNGAYSGVAPYCFVTPGGKPKTSTTRRVGKTTRVTFYNMGNSTPNGTCLGGAHRYVENGSLHPVQAYWNTTFERRGVANRDILFYSALATGGCGTLNDVFFRTFGVRPSGLRRGQS